MNASSETVSSRSSVRQTGKYVRTEENKTSSIRTRTIHCSERYYRGGEKWIPAKIASKTGPVSYRVQVDPTTEWRRHADQIIESNISKTPCDPIIPDVTTDDQNKKQTSIEPTTTEDKSVNVSDETVAEKRYPTRIRKQKIMDDFVYK